MDGHPDGHGANQHDGWVRDEGSGDAPIPEALQEWDEKKAARHASDAASPPLSIPSRGAIIDAFPLPLVTLDWAGSITIWNQAAQRLFGWSEPEVRGLPLPVGSPGAQEEIEDWHRQVMRGEAITAVDTCWYSRDGTALDLSLSWVPLHDDTSRITGSLIVCVDVSERKRREETLAYHAFHDPLTGLPNRMLFRDRLEQSLRSALRQGSSFAVLLLDLDRLKTINDTLGHEAGDMVLQQVAQRLRGSLRESDTAARLGGDEFVVLLVQTDEHGARRTAEKLSQVVQCPMMVGGRELEVRASIGVAIYARGEETVGSLLRGADRAMYTAKKLHHEYAVYSGG